MISSFSVNSGSYLQVRVRFLANLTLSSVKSVPPRIEPE